MSKPAWLIPEVVQTSATDCGPAVLKSIFEGYGVPVRYDRLREACATDVDGTSFDTLESLLEQFGFDTDKALIPPEDLFAPGAETSPAIVVTHLPNGFAHFVVLWRRVGNRVIVMDPAQGRRILPISSFMKELLIHKMPIEAELWRTWAHSRPSFANTLLARLRRAGVVEPAQLLAAASAAALPRSLAALDASARMVDTLIEKRALSRGKPADDFLREIFALAAPFPEREDQRFVPSMYWSAMSLLDQRDAVMWRGVPTLRIVGASRVAAHAEELSRKSPAARKEELPLAKVFGHAPHPIRALWDLLPAAARRNAMALPLLALASALGESVVVLGVRNLLSAESFLRVPYQRATTVGCLVLLCFAVLCLDAVLGNLAMKLGRQVELRFRVAMHSRLALLPDHYYRTRAASDLVERCHTIGVLRTLPELAARWVRVLLAFLCATAGLLWLAPERSIFVLCFAAASLGLPLAMQRPLSEVDMRARSQAGALVRFYLDALMGAAPVRTHRAEGAVTREHERLLVRWVRAEGLFARYAVSVELFLGVLGVGLTGVLLWPLTSGRAPDPAMLLVAYWALGLPALGSQLAVLLRHAFSLRNQVKRLVEPIGVELESVHEGPRHVLPSGSGVELRFEGVTVSTSRKHAILEDIDLHVPAGSHVAIVGVSGAGKSSLLGVLLGWHPPTRGTVLVDGVPLDARSILALRSHTAWVDPAVQLWNRSLFENMTYGALDDARGELGPLVDAAQLAEVLPRLERGLRTELGEGGGLLSGGEGQRVRFARALRRDDARLVLLDEPFRGLDRERRAELLRSARRHWSSATLLCVTHDVGETLGFDRVLVIDGARIVEDGAPRELAARPTKYRALLTQERAVRDALWNSEAWTRIRLEGGQLGR